LTSRRLVSDWPLDSSALLRVRIPRGRRGVRFGLPPPPSRENAFSFFSHRATSLAQQRANLETSTADNLHCRATIVLSFFEANFLSISSNDQTSLLNIWGRPPLNPFHFSRISFRFSPQDRTIKFSFNSSSTEEAAPSHPTRLSAFCSTVFSYLLKYLIAFSCFR